MIGVGSLVGNYQVLEKIGQGAMGSVFSAHHPRIGKTVAIKVMNAELASNEEMLGRFFTEARAVTQIGHENIVEVKDYGQTPEGESFIVMELLEGLSLTEVLKRDGAFTVQRATHVAVQLADGLAAAHARGIIHRDLKPDNIMLVRRNNDNDFVKILDFGLAKLVGPGAGGPKTQTGSLLGTAHYMAPEQAESSKGIDHRVDVYALGCILFQMLSARVPFPGVGFGDVLIKHIREPPPLISRLNSTVPKSLEKIVLHALAKKPDFRFATMEEFRAALKDPERFMANMESSVMSPDEMLAKTMPPPNAAVFDDMPVTVTLPPSAPKLLPQSAATVVGNAPDMATIMAAKATAQRPAQRADVSSTRPGRPSVAPAVAKRPLVIKKKKGSGAGVAVVVALGMVAAGGALGWFLLFGGDVTITIQTNPDGVEILEGDKILGTTPAALKLTRGSTPLPFSFRKTGYLTAQRAVTPSSDQTIKMRLLPKPDETQEEPPPSKPVAAAPAPPPPPAPEPAAPKPPKPVAVAPAPKPAHAPPPVKPVAKAPSRPKKPPKKTDSPLILTPAF